MEGGAQTGACWAACAENPSYYPEASANSLIGLETFNRLGTQSDVNNNTPCAPIGIYLQTRSRCIVGKIHGFLARKGTAQRRAGAPRNLLVRL